MLFDAGGSDWEIVTSYTLPRSFLDGTFEGVTHSWGADGKSHNLIFSGRDIIKRTKDFFPFEPEVVVHKAIPANFSSDLGGQYRHIGDISTIKYKGKEVLLTSVEEPTYTKPLMMMFSADSLAFQHWCELEQHHTSFLAGDGVGGVMWSVEFMDVTELLRYSFPSCAPLPPLPLLRGGKPVTLQGVQGAAVDRASEGRRLFITTNQIKSNGGDVFEVDTASGEILTAMDLVVGLGYAEMEGIEVWEAGGEQRMLVQANLPLFLSVLVDLRRPLPYLPPP